MKLKKKKINKEIFIRKIDGHVNYFSCNDHTN